MCIIFIDKTNNRTFYCMKSNNFLLKLCEEMYGQVLKIKNETDRIRVRKIDDDFITRIRFLKRKKKEEREEFDFQGSCS